MLTLHVYMYHMYNSHRKSNSDAATPVTTLDINTSVDGIQEPVQIAQKSVRCKATIITQCSQ